VGSVQIKSVKLFWNDTIFLSIPPSPCSALPLERDRCARGWIAEWCLFKISIGWCFWKSFAAHYILRCWQFCLKSDLSDFCDFVNFGEIILDSYFFQLLK